MEVYRCSTCGGRLFEAGVSRAVLGDESALNPASVETDRPPRHCFHCAIDMVPIEDAKGGIVDRCTICEAVFVGSGVKS
jgi:hypothetical protein